MPSPSYAQNKQHIMKWRELNQTKYNEQTAKHMMKYRLKKKIQKEIWNEIRVEFLQILII